METFIPYLLKVNIAIIVLYGFYRLFFRKDTFFKSKRMLLLSIYAISLIYPVIDISLNLQKNEPVNRVIVENIPNFSFPEVIITPQNASVGELLISNLLSVVYVTGVVLLLAWTLMQLVSIAVNIYRSFPSELCGIKIRISKKNTSPYSFFRYIVLDEKTIQENDVHEILLHETTHVRQWHSFDVLFSDLMCVFCWFNPFVWLMKHEVRLNLEYLADHSVLKAGCDTEHYQFHILRLTYQKAAANLSNNFNFSPLKKRIQMMNKKQTSGIGYAKYLLFIPLTVVLLLVNNVQAIPKIDIPSKMEEVLSIVESQQTKIDTTKVFSHVQVMPQYPGGDKALTDFISKNLKYPVTALNQGVQGTVTLRFIVDVAGKIGDIEVLRSLDPECDKEAVRVIKSMPVWKPGKQSGKAVAVYYTLPIRFRVTGGPARAN